MTTARKQTEEALRKKLGKVYAPPNITEVANMASDIWEPLLLQFGRHLPGCSIGHWPYSNCDCGLWDALGRPA